MSSVQDTIKCPQCGGCYTTDFDCRTFEEFKFCHRCGKKELIELVRDENGNAVYDAEHKPKYTESSHFGYGCLCLAGKKGGSTLYSMTKPLTDEEAADIQRSFNTELVDVGKSYLTKWDEEKKDVIALFGEVPHTYDEKMAEHEEASHSYEATLVDDDDVPY